MFDTETSKFIKQATPLDGLDLDALPQFLTEAYAEVVAARLGAVRSVGEETEWTNTLVKLRRLAETYEGLTIFLPPDNEHREACAFVAGSAHFTLNQARRLREPAQYEGIPSLSPSGVGPEVAACLLFLIGGHQADAAEAAKAFLANKLEPESARLLSFIAALASGDGTALMEVVRSRAGDPPDNEEYLTRATDEMWRRLARAVQLLARACLGFDGGDPVAMVDVVLKRIESAKAKVVIGEVVVNIQLPLSGPYHLARLLKTLAGALMSSAVVKTPAPSNVAEAEWKKFVRSFATKRPFLWRNHLVAFRAGFLDPGTSHVLTFPTGAGKTTITELRIAAEVLRGRKVVYLAPTRALVDQVAAELTTTLGPLAKNIVRGRFFEDFGERSGAMVYVQTPEQCLAYLSFNDDGHSDLGLIVVDECHQISGERPDAEGRLRAPGRRAVDAMWTLLSLIERSSDADVVLISAMVRNGQQLAKWLAAATERPATTSDLTWKPTRQVRGVVAYNASDIKAIQSTLRTRRAAKPGKKPGKADQNGLAAIPIGLFCHTQMWDKSSTFAKFNLLPWPVPLAANEYWKPTANRNVVGGQLLGAMAHAKMRPIVFSQQIDWTANIAHEGARSLEQAGVPEVALSSNEEALFAAAAEEMGDGALVERPVLARVGVHHGLLLLCERLAMESAFRRTDGLYGLVATPTVAQGVNLPAEAVIIAGDDRRAEGEDMPETLAVHELLNAAGRAGRAGHYAHGIVIDVPSKVFTIEQDEQGIDFKGLSHVMSLFGLPDQCMDVVDPITQVIDRIQDNAQAEGDVGEYLVKRAMGLPDDKLRRLLGATLGNRSLEHPEQAVDEQVAVLREAAARFQTGEVGEEEWGELASQTGALPSAIVAVAGQLPAPADASSWTFQEFLEFATGIAFGQSGMLFGLVDPATSDFNRVINRRTRRERDGTTTYLETGLEWEARWQAALRDGIFAMWLQGVPLNKIGGKLFEHRGGRSRADATKLARRFAIQVSSGLAHAFSIIGRVFQLEREQSVTVALRSQLPLITGCVREGFSQPDMLLLFWHLRRMPGLYPRVRTHELFKSIQQGLPSWIDVSDVDERRSLIRVLVERNHLANPT